MSKAPFGNDPAKIEKYRAFWNREDVKRPLVGFSFIGWFPLGEFTACKTWSFSKYLTPDMIAPEAVMDDYIRLLREGETVDDDLIRGACPMQVAVPFLPGMLGCKLRILPDNVMGEEQHLPWDEAFLEIQEIKCFEINNDVCGPPLEEMVPYFQRVQKAKRPLLIRGSFNPEEMQLLMDLLEPQGLFLNIMVNTMEEVEALRPLVRI